MRALEAKLADRRTGSDCSRIGLRVEGQRGHVVFSTMDGRSAERKIGSPSELEPTVRALDTIGPAFEKRTTPAPEASLKEQSESAPPAPTTLEARESTDAEGARASSAALAQELARTSIRYGALAGGRVGGGGLATPVIDAYASVGAAKWEVGVLGRWEPHYANLADKDAQPRSGALGAGVMVGRRESAGRHVLIVAGGSLLVAAIHEEGSASKERASATYAEGRIGAYLGVIVPRRSTMRFRANLMAEAVPSKVVKYNSDGAPLSQRWGVALMMGVELGGP